MLRRITTFVLITAAGALLLFLQYAVLKLAIKFNSSQIFRRNDGRVHNFIFLKTHKTGSGTLTCIFSRFADVNNLEIAIPMKEVSRFSWPSPFAADEVDIRRLRKEKANILVHHAVYRFKAEFEKVMFPGAKLITILRNPVDRFESQFFYDKFDKLFKEENDENLLVLFLNALDNGWKLNMTFEQSQILKLFKNGMMFDLTGETLNENTPDENFDVLIQEIENDFDIVLLTEYFDEGLVLLRKTFAWTFFDVIYKKQHVRDSRHKYMITEEVKNKIIAINKGDVQLYNHFFKIFQKRLEAYGKDFNRHLEIFRHVNKLVNNRCENEKSVLSLDQIENTLGKLSLTTAEKRLVGEPTTLMPCFCSQLYRDEVSYINYFRKKFKPYYYVEQKKRPNAFCD